MLLVEAFLGRVAKQLFHSGVHVDCVTRFVDDLDRVTADLGDDAIPLFAFAKRLARLLAG
jgi:preprotein translocase subunit Sec63